MRRRKSFGRNAVFVTLMTALVLGMTSSRGHAQKVKPIAVTTTTGLSFGSFTMAGSGGLVTVSAAGIRSVSGGIIALGGTVTAATFSVTGNNNTPYTITLPTSTVLSGPGGSMPINFTAALVTGGVLTGQLANGGKSTFSVGGELTVASNQAPGAYSATLVMTVNY